jgi:Flp pilus assembly pilin Flp
MTKAILGIRKPIPKTPRTIEKTWGVAIVEYGLTAAAIVVAISTILPRVSTRLISLFVAVRTAL